VKADRAFKINDLLVLKCPRIWETYKIFMGKSGFYKEGITLAVAHAYIYFVSASANLYANSF
jgi:hypothetical protein